MPWTRPRPRPGRARCAPEKAAGRCAPGRERRGAGGGGSPRRGNPVPDAVGPLVVQADLRTRKVITSVAVEAPGDGRPATRVNWLLRQLREAPDGLVVEVSFASTRATTAALPSAAKDDPHSLLLANDPKRPPRTFRLALSRPMGTKRGKGERSFVLETRKQAIGFYRDLVQNLRPWRAAPPNLPDERDEAPEEPTAAPPAFSATEKREPTEARPPDG
jgi:hypothetical protein